MPTIRANGIKIAYDTIGDMTKPPLFLVHGLTSSRLAMFDMAQAFIDDRFVIVYDCRGHGQTDKPEEYSLEDHGRDLLALIDLFGYDKADAVGLSMGSYVVGQAAVLDSSRIDHLVIGLAKAYDDGTGSSVAGILKKKGFKMSEVTQEEMLALLQEALWAPTTSQERRAEVMAIQAKVLNHPYAVVLTPKQTAAVNEALIGFDLRPGLKNVTCPTLVISARYDGINPVELGQEIANLVPNSKMVILENSGHMAFAEETEKFITTIKEFLAGDVSHCNWSVCS
jgi:3-oxoadipate enol-lactonase